MNDLRFTVLAAAFAMTACQSAPPSASPAPATEAPAAKVAYYQYVGSRQCEGGGKKPQQLRDELAAAGVNVPQVACGHDGRMYTQGCGGADGRIFVVLVPQAQEAKVAGLGLKPMVELPNAVPLACR